MKTDETAYHEAGHAVVAMKLGYKCWSVSIVPDEDGRPGRAICEDPRRLEQGTRQQRFERYVVIQLAAAIAELKFSHEGEAHDGFDKADIFNAVIEHTGCKEIKDIDAARMKVLTQTRPVAEHLVEQHWEEIEALAQRLLVDKTVLLHPLTDAPD
jgi:hypothetical protein